MRDGSDVEPGWILPALLPMLLALPAQGQDLTQLSLDQLFDVEVVTASRFAQKISEAPSAVTVLTADEIKTYGYRTLADLLRSMRGISVAYDRNYSYLGTRGSGRPGDFNSRVLLLVDGRRLNDGIFGQASIGTEFPVDLELIERVEYVPGPGSAIYGSNAFFGVLNIITKKGKAIGGAEGATEAASHGAYKQRVTYGARFEHGGEAVLSASAYHSGGADLYFPEFDDAASNNGVARRLDQDRYQRLFAKFNWDDLTLEAYYGKRTKGVPTASYGEQFNDPRSRSSDRYFSAAATWQSRLSPTLDLYAHVNLAQYVFQGDFAYSTDAAGLNRDIARSKTLGAELRFLERGWKNHKLIYGVELSKDTERLQQNFNLDPYLLALDADYPKRGHALYLQDEYHWSERLIVSAGLRHDHDGEGGSTNSPRLGIIYKLTPDLTGKLLYGTAFRSANAYERYYVTDAASYKSMPGLRAENIRTYEAIVEYFPASTLRAGASLFAYRLNHLISLVTDPADGLLYFTNIDAATARGIELEAEWLGPDGARLRGSASVQYARNDLSGAWLTNAPRRLVKLNYSRPLWRQARLGVEAQYTSRRATVFEGEVGAFAVVNLTMSGLQLGRHAEVSASLYNVLDKNYADPPSDEHFDNSSPPRFLQGIRQDGRSFRINLLYRF
ncbi:MAG: TonB-dependent receptor [Pseudomonadota bacterium]